ncbi:dolichyl-phosphate-mannose-protein mannosyltransferase [Saccharomycopsis crataegensis]|uniref:Dolichyl-phosphate-mannose--protein mannosyltransferase n=1 Tax=Saccharomycopsis crataegensis TaxID=43959 RepID=A0AAV5QMK5_9ASCO|nr:dolichyl-phosphate-mannose-protein mannosyltransferase [Saccharomycopsis crataegensis]
MAKKTTKKSKASVPSSNSAVGTTNSNLETADPVFEYKVEEGPCHPFVVTTPPKYISDARSPTSKNEKFVIAALVLFTTVVRFYKLSYPDSVVFDEVHFGGFARKYILGNFFMDVHPPLAKMLYAAVGYILGFNGSFEFKNIGDVYPSSVPYVGMRAFPAALGVGTVLFSYLTLRASGCRIATALLTAVLLTIENANTTISRYILLDSPLLFFIAASVYSLKRFENETPFSCKWYKSLILSGIALGCAVSSKWVGLFTIAWAGCYMVWQMWFIFGDLSLSPKQVTQHFFARGLILLGIPALLYCAFFAVHFQMLPNEGDGGAFMSSAFRTTLNGNTVPRSTNARVGVKSFITLRHVNTQGGYLHSHDHLYETGSKQQQITLYPHLDENNVWEIELYNVSTPPTEFVPITDGTKIRLKHKVTQRRLHSHNLRPPMSEQDWQNEASCYGFDGFEGDANDDFIVEIDKPLSKKGAARKELHAIDTVFRLRHAMTGCLLFSHEVKLPKYAFEQQEVTCATQGIRPLSLWYVEVNDNEFLDDSAEKTGYKTPSFFDKLVESHQRMWHINNGLTASHNWESRPPSWPVLQRGINYWVKDHHQIYFLGNAVTWWASSAVIFVYVCNLAALAINWQRGKPLITDPHFINFNIQTLIFVGGWALHYFPSFLMGRQLFLHHYIPAFYFQVLALGQCFDLFLGFFLATKPWVAYSIFVAFLSASAAFFHHFSPLIWGSDWTKSECNASKLLDSWDFDCNSFPESYSEYASAALTPAPTSVVANTPVANGAELNNEQIIQQAETRGKVIRKYQDGDGNPIDPAVAEAYIKDHPEQVLKVETQTHEGIL